MSGAGGGAKGGGPETAARGFATPPVLTADVAIQAQPLTLGWNRALACCRPIEVRSQRFSEPLPRALSISIPTQAVVARSFAFAERENGEPLPLPERPEGGRHACMVVASKAPAPFPPRNPASRAVRIRPPQDVVKLQDRLHYLLQPSLQSLLAERSLEFPFVPFPYQLEGIAFLYPRHAAILADEMGLGKTMQAITAIRLLLRYGEARSVLLVCPKPLVANWQREFGLWAPEVPVIVIEGDQARRLWQWQGAGWAVKIANYELLVRDREVFDVRDAGGAPAVRFDLVVLDESQRIKNRGRPGGDFRVSGPGLLVGGDEAAPDGAHGERLCAAPHQGAGARGPAAQAVP